MIAMIVCVSISFFIGDEVYLIDTTTKRRQDKRNIDERNGTQQGDDELDDEAR